MGRENKEHVKVYHIELYIVNTNYFLSESSHRYYVR